MKQLLAALCLLAGIATAATPIADLKLGTDANGNAKSITNLTDVVLTNGIKLSTVSAGTATNGINSISNATPTLGSLAFAGNILTLSVSNQSGTTIEVLNSNGVLITASGTNRYFTVTNSPLLGGLAAAAFATGTPVYVESETNASARVAKAGDTMYGTLSITNSASIRTISATGTNTLSLTASDPDVLGAYFNYKVVHSGSTYLTKRLSFHADAAEDGTSNGGNTNFPALTFHGISLGNIRHIHSTGSVSALAFSGNGASLTSLDAANLTAGGTFGALNGANLTNLSLAVSVATEGSGNVVTQIVAGGSVVTARYGTVTGGGGVTLQTNAYLYVPNTRHGWMAGSDIAANGGAAFVMVPTAATNSEMRAALRSIIAASTARDLESVTMRLGSVETNWGTITIKYTAWTNAGVAQTLRFFRPGDTNFLAVVTLTNTADYVISGASFSNNRTVKARLSATLESASPSATNYCFPPEIFAVPQ